MIETKGHLYWIWVAVFIITISLIFFVSSILMPFVAGMAVAYFLDPLADKIETLGLSRTIATICIIVSFFVAVLLILILLFPLHI